MTKRSSPRSSDRQNVDSRRGKRLQEQETGCVEVDYLKLWGNCSKNGGVQRFIIKKQKSSGFCSFCAQSFRTLWERAGSSLSPAEKPGCRQPGLSAGPRSSRPGPPGDDREAALPGEAARTAGAPKSRGRRGQRGRPLRPPASPPRTWTRGPARAHPSKCAGLLGPRSPAAPRRRAGGPFVTHCTASGSEPAAGSTGPSAGGLRNPAAPALPGAPPGYPSSSHRLLGPSMKSVAPKQTQRCDAS